MFGNDLISREEGALISLHEGYSDNVQQYLNKFENEEPHFLMADGLRRILLVSLIGGLTPEEMALVLIWTAVPEVTDIYGKTFDSLTLNQQKKITAGLVALFKDEKPYFQKYLNALINNSGKDEKVFTYNEKCNYEEYMSFCAQNELNSMDIGLDILYLTDLLIRVDENHKRRLMNIGRHEAENFRTQIENLDCSDFEGLKKKFTDYFEVPLNHTDIKSRILEFWCVKGF